jgi:hypothetical protein
MFVHLFFRWTSLVLCSVTAPRPVKRSLPSMTQNWQRNLITSLHVAQVAKGTKKCRLCSEPAASLGQPQYPPVLEAPSGISQHRGHAARRLEPDYLRGPEPIMKDYFSATRRWRADLAGLYGRNVDTALNTGVDHRADPRHRRA